MTEATRLCPCNSSRLLNECCAPIHQNHAAATHPEQLMRARYSAHVLGLVDFVVETYHPSCEAEQYRDAIAESVNSTWTGLDVISSEIAASGEGFVEFKAHFEEDGQAFVLQERSRFLQEEINGQTLWFYIDGEYPTETTTQQPAVSTKINRNDPCPCGSGKKYKKCCG